jgi:DNA-binding transcriptional LysR family regulator
MVRSHPLAALTHVPLADLAREPLLCLTLSKESDLLHRELMQRIFAAHGLSTGPIRPIEGPEAFRAALEGGMGVSFVAEIGGISRSQLLIMRPIKETGEGLNVRLHAIWRDGGNSQIVSNFVELMQKIAPRVKPGMEEG